MTVQIPKEVADMASRQMREFDALCKEDEDGIHVRAMIAAYKMGSDHTYEIIKAARLSEMRKK